MNLLVSKFRCLTECLTDIIERSASEMLEDLLSVSSSTGLIESQLFNSVLGVFILTKISLNRKIGKPLPGPLSGYLDSRKHISLYRLS